MAGLWVVRGVGAGTKHSEAAMLVAAAPRLVRVRRLRKFFREQEANLHVDVRVLATAKFALLIVGVAHWVGCAFYYVAARSDFSAARGEETWVAQWEAESGVDFTVAPPPEMYAALHHHTGGHNNNNNNTTGTFDLDAFYRSYNGAAAVGRRYLLVIYKGLSGVTNLSYEDTVPRTHAETGLGLVVMYVQVCCTICQPFVI